MTLRMSINEHFSFEKKVVSIDWLSLFINDCLFVELMNLDMFHDVIKLQLRLKLTKAMLSQEC